MDITPPRIFLFTGYAGAGKTSCARAICNALNRDNPGDAQNFSLAEPIRELCLHMFPDIGPEAFYGPQSVKEKPLEAYPGWSGRRILQHIGTEGFRAIDPNIWVKRTVRRITERSPHLRVITVDDVRFPDEVRGLMELPRATLVRVHRAGHHRGTHASETHIDYFQADHEIYNDGSLEQLEDRVWRVLLG